MAIQADDRIVVLGFLSLDVINFAVVRYNTDGSLDTTFGGTGIVTTTFGGNHHETTAVVVQPDGKVLAVGSTFTNEPNNRDFALARFNADGSPDASFGIDGKVITNFDSIDHLTDVALLQADGRIVATGTSTEASGPRFRGLALRGQWHAGCRLWCRWARQSTSINGSPDFARSVAIQADGKILVAGRTQQGSAIAFADFAIVALRQKYAYRWSRTN